MLRCWYLFVVLFTAFFSVEASEIQESKDPDEGVPRPLAITKPLILPEDLCDRLGFKKNICISKKNFFDSFLMRYPKNGMIVYHSNPIQIAYNLTKGVVEPQKQRMGKEFITDIQKKFFIHHSKSVSESMVNGEKIEE